MKMPRRAVLRALILTAVAAFAGLATANPIVGQEVDIEMDRERMVEFVRAHIAINDARDEFHGAVARVHDPEGRIRAREEVEAAIEAILEEAEMTREVYDQITLLIKHHIANHFRRQTDHQLRFLFTGAIAVNSAIIDIHPKQLLAHWVPHRAFTKRT